jgi:hypothetical protein
MARDGKRVELRPVDDAAEPRVPVIRLGEADGLREEKPFRLALERPEESVSHRLAVPSREETELRTHQPNIEALIEAPGMSPDLMEQSWGAESKTHRQIPWGWFALIALTLVGGVVWSLTRVKTADAQVQKVQAESKTTLIDEEKEDLEAARLIDRIQGSMANFFNARTIDQLVPLVRHPDRVRPLMVKHYSNQPTFTPALKEVRTLQPITLDGRANFWMASVRLENQEKRNFIVEVMDSGEVLIDWETMVCYQPMKWDDFAQKRPQGTSFDFRVQVEEDTFFSHEFADSSSWNCYRLTALESDEAMFGYAKTDSEISTTLNSLLGRNGGKKISVILRLSIPEGIQSRSGVVIEKLLCPRWLYVTPPESDS